MSYKISKKLFEAVTGYEGTIHEYNRECIINGDVEEHISINDFFFMCKEWAYNQGYIIFSSQQKTGWAIFIQTDSDGIIASFEGLEQQAVFDATDYVRRLTEGK